MSAPVPQRIEPPTDAAGDCETHLGASAAHLSPSCVLPHLSTAVPHSLSLCLEIYTDDRGRRFLPGDHRGGSRQSLISRKGTLVLMAEA